MNPFHKLPFLLFAILAVLSGCGFLDPAEDLPIYVDLTNVEVLVDEGDNFTSSLGIKDIWLERNDDFLGIYRLPSIVPVLPGEGTTYILTGGVFESGIADQRVRYPFWKSNFLSFDVQPLDTVKMPILFEYFSDSILLYPFIENFESQAIAFISSPFSSTNVSLGRSTSEFYEGGAAGRALFNENQTRFEIVSSSTFKLPQSGSNDVWVEVTYKNNVPFKVGVYYEFLSQITAAGPDVLFFSNEEWTTAYVHINNEVRMAPDNSNFWVFFRADGEGRVGQIILDNIRIIHFQ
jgi:hypothetical protein